MPDFFGLSIGEVLSKSLEFDLLAEIYFAVLDNLLILQCALRDEPIDNLGLFLRRQRTQWQQMIGAAKFGDARGDAGQVGPQLRRAGHDAHALLQIQRSQPLELAPHPDTRCRRLGWNLVDQDLILAPLTLHPHHSFGVAVSAWAPAAPSQRRPAAAVTITPNTSVAPIASGRL